MIINKNDSVSSIHKRWFFTLINPSSYNTSLAISLLSSVVISGIYFFSIDITLPSATLYILLSLTITVFGIYFDLFLTRGTPISGLSKIIHVSAFSNILWALTLLLGIFSNYLFNKNSDIMNYIIEGMFISISLRFGIFVSVFGANRLKSIMISLIIPGIFLINMIYHHEFSTIGIPILFGTTIMGLGVIWSFMADRSGRPQLSSTFQVLQAFLSAWTEKKQDRMEIIFESKAVVKNVCTQILKFQLKNEDEVAIVLPEVHPGPFSPVGGSNLPYRIFEFFNKRAVVLHSLSDHSLNLPSSSEVENYLNSLNFIKTVGIGNKCTHPIQVNSLNFILTGIAFGNYALIIISKETGMQDLPESVGAEIKIKASGYGFNYALVVDSHNSVGEKITISDEKNIVKLAIQCLDQLSRMEQHLFKIGYSNSYCLPAFQTMPDSGESGFAILNIEVENTKYFFGWSDSNNITHHLRRRILTYCQDRGLNILEVSSSDTHSTSGKRNRKGYYSLGDLSNHDEISELFFKLGGKSIINTVSSCFSFLESKADIKLMGKNQFDNYSQALDRSLNVTKIFLAVTTSIYILMLVVT